MEKKPKKLHGNSAKIDPNKHVEGLYATNMATLANDDDNQSRSEREAKVDYAKKFVEVNEK
ncbi:MAG: hypothetical protein LBV27_04775 [Oscillospiraceae bacterium]|nr:hypothetical protein [Oscillospiraceae bacterium]